MLRRILPLLLCSAPLAACAPALAAGATYMVGQEVTSTKVHVAQVLIDVEPVWSTTQEVVREMAGDEPVHVTDFPRRLTTKIDDRAVTVTVEAYDLNRTIIKVEAMYYMTADEHQGGRVMNRIIDRLAKVAPQP